MIIERQTSKTRYIAIGAAIVANIVFSVGIVKYFKMPYFNIIYICIALVALDLVRSFLTSVTSWAVYYMSGKKLLALTFKNILNTYSYKIQESGYYDFKSYFVDVMNDDGTRMDLRLDAARNLGIMDVITSTSMQYGWQYLSAWEEALEEYKYYKKDLGHLTTG